MVTSNVYNTRTNTSVLGTKKLVLMPPKIITSSVYDTRTKMDVLGIKILVVVVVVLELLAALNNIINTHIITIY